MDNIKEFQIGDIVKVINLSIENYRPAIIVKLTKGLLPNHTIYEVIFQGSPNIPFYFQNTNLEKF